MSVNWYFIVLLIYISLMTNGLEYLFICLFAICISILEKCLLISFAYILIGLFIFFVSELQGFFNISWTLDFYHIYDLQIFFTIL